MAQKEIFEDIYSIVLTRGIDSISDVLNSMYESYINTNPDKKSADTALYLRNKLVKVFEQANDYRNSIAMRGISVSDKNFFESQKIKSDNLKQDLSIVETEDTIFYNKVVVVTGVFSRYVDRNKLALILKKLGADLNTTISKKTNIVCLGGNGVGPAKMAKVAELQNSGVDIRIIEEYELYDILDNL